MTTERKIIEVLGSPDAGKTTALKTLAERLTSQGVSTELVLETRGKNIFSKAQRGTLQYNCNVAGITCKRISDCICKSSANVILVDKGYIDFLYWNHYYLYNHKCTLQEKAEADKLYADMLLMPDIIIAMVCTAEEAARRCEDPISTRTVKVQKSIDCLNSFYSDWNKTEKHFLDTTELSKFEVVSQLLNFIR